MPEYQSEHRDNKGRFVRGNPGGGRYKAISKVDLSSQHIALQMMVDALPEVAEFLLNQVRNNENLAAARLLVEKAMPNMEVAGVVVNAKMDEMAEEIVRLSNLLTEAGINIEKRDKEISNLRAVA